ncbi:MAG: MliC family protein [Gammaproteobacteria bacterium]
MPTAALPLLALALALTALAGCGRSEVPSTPRPAVQPPAAESRQDAAEPPADLEDVVQRDPPAGGSFSFEAYAYVCDGREIVVRPGDAELTLITADGSIVMPQVEAASGAKYGDDVNGFWGKGIDSALLTLDGEDIPCTLNRRETPWADARARGALFRGLGQEPGWHLEIHPERIVIVYQYGERRVVVPNPGAIADLDKQQRRWQATTEAHELVVVIEDRACTDVMSGEIYPAKVTATLDGRDYTGCGRDLE